MASLEKQDLPNVAQLMDELRAANEALAVSTKALAEADVRHKAMIGELNHRVRNMLAAVSAMASQTLARHVDDDTLDMFQERLHAMARTYKMLTEAGWSALSFHELVHETLAAVADPRRFSLDGPPLALAPREALALGMVLHELTANALNHGALSNMEGRVDVRWENAGGRADAVAIRWTESGGPPVAEPSHRGFGTLMVERQLAYELQGHSTLTYARGGLLATLHLPLLQVPEEHGHERGTSRRPGRHGGGG
ncbi:sensor histidine kinase [Rhodanobacter caeni]|uniref:histidine kinase n=1 Tax=Rhodanobacter caeni TaxID=657654 RepID=A0ABP3DVX8_9GAMM